MNFVWAIALLVVSFIITALITPRAKTPANQDALASMFKDINIPIPDEGAAQAVVFGDCWTPDWQVIWYGNMSTTPITVTSGGGGK
jgi:hypothetical protein